MFAVPLVYIIVMHMVSYLPYSSRFEKYIDPGFVPGKQGHQINLRRYQRLEATHADISWQKT